MLAVGVGMALWAGAESVTNNLNLNKGIIYNHGAVKPDEVGLTFTTDVSDDNLIYVLRRFEDTTELCMRRNGEETLRLRGDGSIYATGTLEVGGLSFGGGGSSGSTGWFIPEEGDLSMGSFTQE